MRAAHLQVDTQHVPSTPSTEALSLSLQHVILHYAFFFPSLSLLNDSLYLFPFAASVQHCLFRRSLSLYGRK